MVWENLTLQNNMLAVKTGATGFSSPSDARGPPPPSRAAAATADTGAGAGDGGTVWLHRTRLRGLRLPYAPVIRTCLTPQQRMRATRLFSAETL